MPLMYLVQKKEWLEAIQNYELNISVILVVVTKHKIFILEPKLDSIWPQSSSNTSLYEVEQPSDPDYLVL